MAVNNTAYMRPGFTLTEVLIAIVLVGVGITSIYGLYLGLADSLVRAQERAQIQRILSDAGQYAQLKRLFPDSPDGEQKPVIFVYQERSYTIMPVTCAEQSMIKKTGLHAYQVMAQDHPGQVMTYLIAPEPKKTEELEKSDTSAMAQKPSPMSAKSGVPPGGAA